ncbi:MAG: multiheme c-type cytochrome, partial [Planctomycetota bacterium]|nr:multiheme c-type cytochrome [Planctomycetota bacterium]
MKRSIPQIITVAILMMMVYPALVDQRHQASAQPGSQSNRPLTQDDSAADDSAATDDSDEPSKPSDSDDSEATGDHDLFLVFSINNVGYIDVCGCKRKKVRQGSITRRSAYINQARFHHKNLVLIDGGNTLFGTDDGKKKDFAQQQLLAKAKLIIESYNRMGYQAMLVGHHDLTLGLPALLEFQKQAQFPLLSANLVYADDQQLIFPPSTIIESDGMKIGVLGLTIDTIPSYFLEKANPERPLALLDAVETAKKLIPQLREQCDMVVLLSANHIGTNRQLAAEVDGIDLMIDPMIELGNHKIWIDEEDSLETINNTLLARTDSQGARLGTIAIDWVEGGSPMVSLSYDEAPPAGRSTYWYERASMEPHLLEDPEIVEMVNSFKKNAKFLASEKLPPLHDKDKYLTAATCSVCHVEQTEFWQKTKHATAFASLEETDDQWRQDCIACHVLGYGQAFIAPEDAEPYKNVQCENCHGLNPDHPRDPVNHQWPSVKETACLVCHNKNQTLE